jgi:hypothetical protein
MHTLASALLSRPSLVSRRLGTPPVRVFVVTWSQFRPHWRFPRVSAWPIFMFPVPLIISLPFVGAVTLEVAWLTTAPASCLFCVSLSGGEGGVRYPRYVLVLFFGVWLLPIRSAVLVLAGGPRLRSFLLLAAVEFLCRGLLPSLQRFSLLLSLCGLRVEWGRHDGQAVQWPWQSLAGILRPSRSLLIDSGKQL